ncbi:MAG: flagellar motor switch protein FliN [Calditrichia bacterium]
MSDENERMPVDGNTEEELLEEQMENVNEMPEVSQAKLENFEKPGNSGSSRSRLELIMDIVLPVSIELGRTRMYVKDVLELERGSIIELDKMAGEPVDLYINNKKMAEGEVVVVDKHFGIRITHLIDPEDRIKNLGKEN